MEYTSKPLKSETLKVIQREQVRREEDLGFLRANFETIARDAQFSQAAREVVEAYTYHLRHPEDEAAKALLTAKFEAYMSEG